MAADTLTSGIGTNFGIEAAGVKERENCAGTCLTAEQRTKMGAVSVFFSTFRSKTSSTLLSYADFYHQNCKQIV